MKSLKLGVLLLAPAVAAATGNRAVLETNYEVRSGYQNRDLGDTYAVDGWLTMPLLTLGGVAFLGGHDQFEGGQSRTG